MSSKKEEKVYPQYPVFKGLQLPLEFMGIRGKFLAWGGGTIGAAFLSFVAGYLLFGMGTAFLIMAIVAGAGIITIFIKQKHGLHSKRRNRDVQVYRNVMIR